MRIVGSITHPRLKISIFHHAERYAVKFESSGVEVTYKFSSEEGAKDLAAVKVMMDDPFIATVEKQIEEMISLRGTKIAEVLPRANEGEFDDII
jgi:spore coat polysaccharide biosynthesis predicted glycosyltransferase SpsG